MHSCRLPLVLTYLITYLFTYLFTYLLIYLLTYLLTPHSTFLLEKLTDSQLVNKFPAFYGTRKFITAFTSSRHLSLSWASSIQSIPPKSHYLKFHLNIILPSTPGFPKWSFSLIFPHQNLLYASPLPHTSFGNFPKSGQIIGNRTTELSTATCTVCNRKLRSKFIGRESPFPGINVAECCLAHNPSTKSRNKFTVLLCVHTFTSVSLDQPAGLQIRGLTLQNQRPKPRSTLVLNKQNNPSPICCV